MKAVEICVKMGLCSQPPHPAAAGRLGDGSERELPVKSINIKAGYPTAERAMLRLSQELRIAGANRVRVLKVLHRFRRRYPGGGAQAAL